MLENLKNNFSLWRLLLIILALQIFLSLASVKILALNVVTINAIAIIAMFFAFYLLKNGEGEEDIKKCVSLLKVSVIISFLSFGLLAVRSVLHGNTYITGQMLIILFAGLATIGVLLTVPEKQRAVWDKIAKQKGFVKLNKRVKLNKGDVILCKNKETGEPALMRRDDRFLHSLILGPTGTGKTAQILLPLARQDVLNRDIGITIIDPKGDFAEQVYALAKLTGRDAFFFDPTATDCPKFNPLYGEEAAVITNVTTTFERLEHSTNEYFKNLSREVMTKSIKVLKRTRGNNVTLVTLSNFINNNGNFGREMINELSRKKCENEYEEQENREIATWFNNQYFAKDAKNWENSSGCRSQLATLLDNEYIRRILDPEDGKTDIDFVEALAQKKITCITTSQGALGTLSTYLGFFLIFEFQSAVLKRPGNENTRPHHALYIDEFQTYANPKFGVMLNQGRSYRVASILATQSRKAITLESTNKAEGEAFLSVIETNCRNIVLLADCNPDDVEYYSKAFGSRKVERVSQGSSKSNGSFFSSKSQRTSVSQTVTVTDEAYFSPTELKHMPFGQLVYRVIENKTAQLAAYGLADYIPVDLKAQIDEYVAKYHTQENIIVDKDGNRLKRLGSTGIIDDTDDDEEYNEVEERVEAVEVEPIEALPEKPSAPATHTLSNEKEKPIKTPIIEESKETSSTIEDIPDIEPLEVAVKEEFNEQEGRFGGGIDFLPDDLDSEVI